MIMDRPRLVIPGSKSKKERERRAASHQETVENLEAAGFPTGGFGDSIYSRMSPGLRLAIAEAEAEEAFEAAKAEQDRAYRAQMWQERSEEAARQSAVREAMERGEDAGPRALRGERLGHTVGEFLALMSERQDYEDMQAEAAQRQAFRRWQSGLSADSSVDTSAPTALQLEEGAQIQARAKRYRQRQYERQLTAAEIRSGAI